jgi:hypothetical protein
MPMRSSSGTGLFSFSSGAVFSLCFLLAQLLLHRDCCTYCALGMVLVGHRGAEQRENAVAGRLHHAAVVAMHRLHHELEHWVDDGASLLGVEVAHQLGRAFDIGEQRGDRLALAVEWGILGGVYPRGLSIALLEHSRLPIAVRRRQWSRKQLQRLAALGTEFGVTRVFGSAFRANGSERCSTLIAKPCACRIIVSTIRAPHRPNPRQKLAESTVPEPQPCHSGLKRRLTAIDLIPRRKSNFAGLK